MILELELGALVALQAVAVYLAWRGPAKIVLLAHKPGEAPAVSPSAAPHAHLEIVKRVGDRWLFHGLRHRGHPDVAEALATPGLAVRHADGRIEEGAQ